MKRKTINIFVVTHGPLCRYICPHPIHCYPIEVGAANRNSFIYPLHDDQGINISKKNSSYAELTALYWAWKNDTSADIIGFYHYRRFFFLYSFTIKKALKKNDFIVPFGDYHYELKKKYLESHVAEDWYNMMDAIRIIHPEDYEKAIEVQNIAAFFHCNMFITTKEKFSEYCEWLFPILEYVEKHADPEKHTGYQSRYIGFLGERLFSIYIAAKRMKVYETDIVRINEPLSKKKILIKKFDNNTKIGIFLKKIVRKRGKRL